MAGQGTQRVALVTGAGRGIGRATALALAREGYALCLAARSFEELKETRRLSGLEPVRSLIVLTDLAGEESPQELFDAALGHFRQIDVLVNNAGWAPARTPLIKTGAAAQDRILAVNLRAPIALTRLAAARMVKSGGGAIVNIASAAARNTPAGEAVYAAAKAGLVAFSRAAFAELRSSGVKLTVIVPGLVDTALIPHNKHLDRALMLGAEDVAEAVMGVLRTPARACPVEIALEPQRNPERAR
ncbi:MAG TPA: SDR family oxidoreductase [Candidatus Binataceae bacterium]|nr:SDR family oxidoreductase [Candidatus Binataceae bacterium]